LSERTRLTCATLLRKALGHTTKTQSFADWRIERGFNIRRFRGNVWFEALAAGGGKISFPIHDTFWGSKFGMLTDAFGVSWMFNCEIKKG
jgi:hypothetical protein